METQLVRLDAPYNLICNENGEFGLHIATLIAVRGFSEALDNTEDIEVRSYPVVAQKHTTGGKTWSQELERCMVFAENATHSDKFGEGGHTTLRTVNSVVNYLDSMNNIGCASAIVKCMAMAEQYNLGVDLIGLNSITDVELVFDIETGRSIVCSAPDSKLYFFMSFFLFTPDESRDAATESSRLETKLEYMLNIRSAYLTWFGVWGLKDITFSTKDEAYQQYVDQLNEKAHAK